MIEKSAYLSSDHLETRRCQSFRSFCTACSMRRPEHFSYSGLCLGQSRAHWVEVFPSTSQWSTSQDRKRRRCSRDTGSPCPQWASRTAMLAAHLAVGGLSLFCRTPKRASRHSSGATNRGCTEVFGGSAPSL